MDEALHTFAERSTSLREGLMVGMADEVEISTFALMRTIGRSCTYATSDISLPPMVPVVAGSAPQVQMVSTRQSRCQLGR